MPIKVEKKDGQLEDFDRNKVSGAVSKAGVPGEVAGSLAVLVEYWVQSAGVNGVIRSNDIRNKVIEILRLINREIATTFEAYRKE